jgi:short-subunit dehydrogenase
MTTPDITAGLAVVTGASSGIGLALARQFAEHGHNVVVAAEDDRIHRVAEELAAPHGVTVTPVQVDLATPEGVEQLYAAASVRGPIGFLALNAGIGVGGRFDQTPLEDDLRLVDLNVRATVHLAKLVIRDMVRQGSGRVLVTSSIAAVAPGPFHAAYAASKAYVHSFAEGIREELKSTGVTVTSLMPGPTDTEFSQRAHMTDTKIGRGPKDAPDAVAAAGYEALVAGRASVVPGSIKNRIQAEIATHLPDVVAAPLLGSQTKPRAS